MIGFTRTWTRHVLFGATMTFCLGAFSASCMSGGDGSTTQAVRPSSDSGSSTDSGTDSGTGGGDGGTCSPLDPLRTLHTYMQNYLEVDRLSDTPDPSNPLLFSADDANLVTVGTTPGYPNGGHCGSDLTVSWDGDSCSRHFPPSGSNFTFVDWGDLGQPTDVNNPDPLRNHRILDGVNGGETSMFPRKNDSCISAGQIGLDKQDLTYIGAANNDAYVYLIVQRRDNNGDSGYVWLFTRDQPIESCTTACQTGERLLQYNVRSGDVLVLGEFNPSNPTRLRVFTALSNPLYPNGQLLNAYDAINSDNTTLWNEVTTTAVTAANTTTTPPTIWGSANVTAVDSSGRLLHDIVAEAAVDIHTFIGNGSTCGASFWGTVISRSSTSTTSDLKDLVGPARFDFGSLTASARLTQTCDQRIHLHGSATDQDNNTLPTTGTGAITCSWVIDGDTMNPITGCDTTTGSLSAGTHTATLTVTGGSSSCTNTAAPASITILSPISVSASSSGNCSGQLTYNATPSGVAANAVSYAWTWTTPGPTANFTSTVQGETNRAVTPDNVLYSGSVVITELTARTGFDTVCTASNTTSATPYTALQASLAASSSSIACGADPTTADSDKVRYTLTVTGRDGTYSLSGFPSACNGGTAPTSVIISGGTGTVTCDINPSGDNTCFNVTMQITVDDTVSSCTDPVTSNLHYQKVSRVCVCTVGDTTCESRCTLPP